jgi:hypothetical protein
MYYLTKAIVEMILPCLQNVYTVLNKLKLNVKKDKKKYCSVTHNHPLGIYTPTTPKNNIYIPSRKHSKTIVHV